MRNLLFRSLVTVALIPTVLFAGKLTTNDGTVYEGDIKKLGGSFSVRTTDGLKLISGKDVKSIDDPTISLAPAPAAPGSVLPANSSADFARTQRQAEKVDSAVLGVTLWQKFVDTHKTSPELPAAQKELTRWQDMVKQGAENINGKWVVGEDLKKLHKDVNKKFADAVKMLRGDQTLKGVQGMEDILKIYPNYFPANFEMGFYYLVKINRVEGSNAEIDKSIKSLETAAKLKPNSPATLSNLAIAYSFRRRWEESVLMAYKAAQLQDDDEIVQNLYTALEHSPPGMLKNDPKIVPILSDAQLLVHRHNVKQEGGWLYVRPHGDDSRGEGNGEGELARHGIVGSGTGFFIADSGYIITNRHVAAHGDKLIAVLSDGRNVVAEKVVVDDDQDIAILKIKTDKPVPFVKLAAYDEPPVGEDVTVMGFPLGASMGMHVKITRGVVTSVETDKDDCDVIVDAQVNPGNSGGPMLDKDGNLLALVAMKTLAVDESISSYGLGISTARLRKFFEHQKEKLTGFKILPGDKAATAMSTQDIAAKFTPATVMILIVAGDLPDELKK